VLDRELGGSYYLPGEYRTELLSMSSKRPSCSPPVSWLVVALWSGVRADGKNEESPHFSRIPNHSFRPL
jgi:hypothetical protein